MIHAYLLFLSALAAVPIVLHMLKRGKPKPITFPAMRFLLEKQTQSRRRMHLQNILLLLLRIALIVVACLALARIQIANPGIDLGQGASMDVAIVLKGRQHAVPLDLNQFMHRRRIEGRASMNGPLRVGRELVPMCADLVRGRDTAAFS